MVGPVFVGITTLDVVQYAAEPLRPGYKTRSGRSWLGTGGPAANAAICCAHLTGAATLVSAVGHGPAAELVRSELATRRVKLIDCAAKDFILPVAAIVVTLDGERTVISPGAVSSRVGATPEALAAMTGTDVLLVDGHHPGLGEAARAAMPARGSPGRPLVVADAGSVKAVVEDWLSGWIDVLAGSQDYATGLGATPEQACRHALDQGAGAAVITCGADPLHWADARGRQGTHRPPLVQARDTLGAGDVFHGALVAALNRPAGTGGPPARLDRLAEAVARAGAVASAAVADPTARGWLTPDLRARWQQPPG